MEMCTFPHHLLLLTLLAFVIVSSHRTAQQDGWRARAHRSSLVAQRHWTQRRLRWACSRNQHLFLTSFEEFPNRYFSSWQSAVGLNMADASSVAGKSATTGKSGKTGASSKVRRAICKCCELCVRVRMFKRVLFSRACVFFILDQRIQAHTNTVHAKKTAAHDFFLACYLLFCCRTPHQPVLLLLLLLIQFTFVLCINKQQSKPRTKVQLTEHARNARLGRELLGHCVFLCIFCIVTIVPVDDPNIENFTYSMRSLFLQVCLFMCVSACVCVYVYVCVCLCVRGRERERERERVCVCVYGEIWVGECV